MECVCVINLITIQITIMVQLGKKHYRYKIMECVMYVILCRLHLVQIVQTFIVEGNVKFLCLIECNMCKKKLNFIILLFL